MTPGTDVQALVVGGAAAGLSAALVLGRARVPTVVVDAGEPSNRVAHAIGGLLGQDGTSPADFYAAGRAQLAQHPAVELRGGAVTDVAADGDGFRATLADGSTITAARILLAGGMSYDLPDVEGLAGLWGDTAFQCPYCHGWELRDRRIALLGAGGAAHRVPLLRGWAQDLVVVPDGPLPDEDRAVVEAAGVPVDERRVTAVGAGRAGAAARGGAAADDGGDAAWVRFADGDELAVGAIHVLATLRPRDALATQLGLDTEDTPLGDGFVVADRWGATSDPRVFAAGDRVGAGNVAASVAGGNLAATGLHRSLVF